MKTADQMKEWLTEFPPPEEVDVASGIESIPIGVIETNLDEFDEWKTEEFQFRTFSINNNYFASGSLQLICRCGASTWTRTGSATFRIKSTDDNQHYEPTVQSYCIANGAKRLGVRFGRHFNNRMSVSEEGILLPPSVNIAGEVEPEKTRTSLADIINKIQQSPSREAAEEFISKEHPPLMFNAMVVRELDNFNKQPAE